MITIRAFTPEDYPAICMAWNATWPHIAWTPEELTRDAERLEEKYRPYFLVAERGSEFVGFVQALRHIGSFHPQKWAIDVIVPAAYRRQGVGTALYDAILAWVLPQDPIKFTTNVFENDLDSVRFAATRGYTERKRDFESELNLADLDLGAVERIEARGLPEGIEIRRLAEIDTPEMRRAFHELFEEVRKDTPRSEPPTRLTFDFFCRQVIEDPDFIRDGTMLALDADGNPIAFCGVFRSPFEGSVEQWLTATKREWRGKGLAAALKAAGIRWALETGVQKILTDNDSRNAHMLSINDRLGFQRKEAFLSMSKDLVGETSG